VQASLVGRRRLVWAQYSQYTPRISFAPAANAHCCESMARRCKTTSQLDGTILSA
jgi:hypothetical protein